MLVPNTPATSSAAMATTQMMMTYSVMAWPDLRFIFFMDGSCLIYFFEIRYGQGREMNCTAPWHCRA